MGEVENLTKKVVDEGGVLALLYFDIHGSDKDVLVQLGTGLVQKIVKENGVIFAKGEIDEPIENEGMFATSLELKVLTKDILSLAELCANFSPFSLEVLEPSTFKIPLSHMQDVLMFVATNAHDYKKYIIQKLSATEQGSEFAKSLKARADLGKKLLEKKKEE